MTGILSVVATPIGNLEDITLRALRVLKEADVIFCEDTRVTKKLLAHYNIHTPTRRYDAHASEARHDEVVAFLTEGKHVALVSDAGTPAISDPGVLLVARAREVGARIEVIPGPSALTAALSISGIPVSEFTFLGFLPHKKGRQTLFKEMSESARPVVFYESPHRIVKALESLVVLLAPERKVVIARELTKMYEEVFVGSAEAALLYLTSDPNHQRGEFVILIEGLR